MKVAFYQMGLHNKAVATAFGGMYQSFFAALNQQPEIEVKLVQNLEELKWPDVLVVPMGDGQEQTSCRAMVRFQGPVILYVQPAKQWLKKNLLKRWHEQILFVYSTDASSYSEKAYKKLGLAHLHFPFGSDPNVFRPLAIQPLYDVVFVGNATSGTGRHQYISALMTTARQKKWQVLLLGSGWEQYGYPYQLVAHGSLLNLVYNSARVGVNISNQEQLLGKDQGLDANNRLFDLSMARVCQVSNGTELVSNYFSKNEVLTADTPKAWVALIGQLLTNDGVRAHYAQAAYKRARKEHAWHVRAQLFAQVAKASFAHWQPRPLNREQQWRRALDCYTPPLDYYYRIGQSVLKKLGN